MNENKRFFDDLASIEKMEPYQLCYRVAQAGQNWAETDAAASALEESKKAVLAQLISEMMHQPVPTTDGKPARPLSASMAEIRALADPRYQGHLTMMIDARRDANAARVRYDVGRMYLELMRSKYATQRQEMIMTRGS